MVDEIICIFLIKDARNVSINNVLPNHCYVLYLFSGLKEKIVSGLNDCENILDRKSWIAAYFLVASLGADEERYNFHSKRDNVSFGRGVSLWVW